MHANGCLVTFDRCPIDLIEKVLTSKPRLGNVESKSRQCKGDSFTLEGHLSWMSSLSLWSLRSPRFIPP